MSYSTIKLIHILGVVLFLGNIITGLFWMHIAIKTKELSIIRHTMKVIIFLDKIFTVPGVLIITIAGVYAAIQANFPLLKTGWIFWSIVMFSLSGIIFGLRVGPLQKKIVSFTIEKDQLSDSDWKVLIKLIKQWDFWGILAIITPLIAFVMMVIKRPE